MIRFYVTPIDLIGEVRQIRYFPTSTGFTWDHKDYGFELVTLVMADTDATQHAAIIADPEIYAFPDDLDTTIPNAPAVRAELEPYGIPLAWITNGLAWRLVVRYTVFLFTLAQFLTTREWREWGGGWNDLTYDGTILPTGADYNTVWEDLPVIYKAALMIAFARIGWVDNYPWNPNADLPDWGMTGVTLREVLEGIQGYTQNNPYDWNGVSI